jgi:hypothetical protein
MVDTAADELLKISAATFVKFGPWYSLCQDVAENMYPERADFTTTLALENFAGTLFDGYPSRARETLGNSIDAMLRQGNWFSVGTGDIDLDQRPANKVSLNRSTGALKSIVRDPRSGWMDATKEADMDWVSFGTSIESVEESSTRDYVIFRAWHPGNCAWVYNENRVVDMFFRKMKMGAREIVRRIDGGQWNGTASAGLRERAKLDPSAEVSVEHCLMTADDMYGGDRKDMRRNKHPFTSCYIDVESREILHKRGTPVFNYVVSRARSLSGKPFGFSPMALGALSDARMLQDMALVIIEQGQKAVDPPTLGAGNVFTRDINFFAGGHTEVDLEPTQKIGDVFTTLDTGQRLDTGLELKQDVRNGITEAMLLNKLMLPSLRDMREVEVMVRTEEFRRAALPFFQPIELNRHSPLLSTAWQVAQNMGIIHPDMFTAELRGRETRFTFESPLNEAEGKIIVQKYNDSLNILAAGAQVDKSVATIFDIRKATEEALSQGGKPEWLVPENERRQADQNAQVVSGLAQGADIARQAAGVTADVANASMAAQQAGLAPPPAA